MIEDIAPIDDDEENYGEYQGARVDAAYGATNVREWEVRPGETRVDHYADQRKAKVKVKE